MQQVGAAGAVEAVEEDNEARLAELVQRVGDGLERFPTGKLDAFEADQVIFQYSRAAKELWKFCMLSNAELSAGMIRDGAVIDWWERGATRHR